MHSTTAKPRSSSAVAPSLRHKICGKKTGCRTSAMVQSDWSLIPVTNYVVAMFPLLLPWCLPFTRSGGGGRWEKNKLYKTHQIWKILQMELKFVFVSCVFFLHVVYGIITHTEYVEVVWVLNGHDGELLCTNLL